MRVLVLVFCLVQKGSFFEQSTVDKKSYWSCGLQNAGPMVQKLTTPLSESTGLFWTHRTFDVFGFGDKLSFVDRGNAAICRWTPDGNLNRLEIVEGKRAVSIHPIQDTTLNFVVGLDNYLYHVNVTGVDSQYYNASLIMEVTSGNNSVVKVKTDPTQALWITISDKQTGSLVRVDPGKKIRTMVSNFTLPNGFAWSGDWKFFYIVDELARIVYQYPYDYQTRKLGATRRICFDANVLLPGGGLPTDVTVDSQGYLWISFSHISQVMQFDPKKNKILRRISIPSEFLNSLEFGGYGLRDLFVGTSQGLDSKRTYPDAGAVFAISGINARGVGSRNVANYL